MKKEAPLPVEKSRKIFDHKKPKTSAKLKLPTNRMWHMIIYAPLIWYTTRGQGNSKIYEILVYYIHKRSISSTLVTQN
jgi:hypothetical protein